MSNFLLGQLNTGQFTGFLISRRANNSRIIALDNRWIMKYYLTAVLRKNLIFHKDKERIEFFPPAYCRRYLVFARV